MKRAKNNNGYVRAAATHCGIRGPSRGNGLEAILTAKASQQVSRQEITRQDSALRGGMSVGYLREGIYELGLLDTA
jgi:hypothetical protein